MPNLVGTNLQKAQNAIQKLTGDPIFITGSHDATGRGRHQLLDADWQVCSQNIPAGTKFNAKTKIDFATVKQAEKCP
jgi:beta-lactam-binding protein with PASTA domain